MRPRKTPLSKTLLSLPGGNEDNLLDIMETVDEDGHKLLVSSWEPTGEERESLAAGGRVLLIVHARPDAHPPVGVAVGCSRRFAATVSASASCTGAAPLSSASSGA